MGDIVGAASVLDVMVDRTVQAAHRHYHQAIIACKNSNHSRRHEVAIYLFDTMIRKSIHSAEGRHLLEFGWSTSHSTLAPD